MLEASTMLLNALTVVTSVAWAVNMVYGLYKTSGSILSLARFNEMTAIAKANRAVGGIGLVLAVGATVGLFVYAGMSSGLFSETGGIAFNTALAYAIATTIVTLVLFLIDLIPAVGSLFVLTIYFIDALLLLACKCKGVQDLLTEALAKSLYDIDSVITNFGSTERLDYDIDIAFTNPEAGFTTDNGVIFTANITNTLRYDNDNSPGDAKKTTVQHRFSNFAAVGIGAMVNSLSTLAGSTSYNWFWGGNGGAIQNIEHVSRDAISFGLAWHRRERLDRQNQPLRLAVGGPVRAVALPYRGCWKVLGITAKCNKWQGHHRQQLAFPLDGYYKFDILPTTLTRFHDMNWNTSGNAGMSLPAQTDLDGDGLTSATDPYTNKVGRRR